MKDLSLKQNVLKEIMDLMSEREGKALKNHPKLVAAKVEIAKPEGGLMDKLKEGEEKPEMEMHDGMMGEEMDKDKMGDIDIESLDPEMLEKLLALADKKQGF